MNYNGIDLACPMCGLEVDGFNIQSVPGIPAYPAKAYQVLCIACGYNEIVRAVGEPIDVWNKLNDSVNGKTQKRELSKRNRLWKSRGLGVRIK